MVAAQERTDAGFDALLDGAGDIPPPATRTAQADGDDPRDLFLYLTDAFDSSIPKRPGVQVIGTSSMGMILADDVLIDIQRTPAALTQEGVTPETTTVVVISSLGWLSMGNDGIRNPSPEFSDLTTPTPEQAREIAFGALEAVLMNPPQRTPLSQAV